MDGGGLFSEFEEEGQGRGGGVQCGEGKAGRIYRPAGRPPRFQPTAATNLPVLVLHHVRLTDPAPAAVPALSRYPG